MAKDSDAGTLVVGGSVIGLLGVGWFALSHLVMGTATGDAIVEALGVMLALLVVASVVGSLVRAARADRVPAEEATDDPGAS